MDKRIRIPAVIIALALAMLILPTLTFAEGEAHGEEHHFDWWGLIGKTFNAALLFGGLIFLARKPLINLLAQKSLAVKNDIIQREEQLKNTAGQLEQIQKHLEELEQEIQTMKNNAKKSGNHEKKRIEQLGKKEAQRIRNLTEKEIDTKMETTVRNLKEKIADLAIRQFKQDIQTHLDRETHEQLIEKNIAQISGETLERK
jgi:F0F1-type ATP synthase membrane subunit b/b'